MALTLNAEQKSIYNIFSGENQYVIPPYQRAYSWTNTQCKALFEDIKKAFYETSQEGYFLGNIVLAKSREEGNKLEVIDGQQRLISLTLLLRVLLSFDKNNKALHNAIWIKDRRTDKELQRVETNIFMEQDYNYLKEVLAFDFSKDICNSISNKDELFRKNICYFYKELNVFRKHNDILKFSDFLLDNVSVLPIETEDVNAEKARTKALKIFETINNRGLNLSTSDIFKARLYSMALNESKYKEFIDKWKRVEQNSNRINYKVDVLFEIYAYILERIEIKKSNLRIFFLENKKSPFLNKNFDEILDNLLKIIESISFYTDVSNSPKKYPKLAKYFHIIKYIDNEKVDNRVILELYNSNLKSYSLESDKEYNKLTLFSREYIRKFILDNYEMKNIPIEGLVRDSYNLPKDVSSDFFILLCFYLNEKQSAIPNPFYINKIMNRNTLIELDSKKWQKIHKLQNKDGSLNLREQENKNKLYSKLWLLEPLSSSSYKKLKDTLGNKIVVDFSQTYSDLGEQGKFFLESNIEEIRQIGEKLLKYKYEPIDLQKRNKELLKRLAVFLDEQNDEYRKKHLNEN